MCFWYMLKKTYLLLIFHSSFNPSLTFLSKCSVRAQQVGMLKNMDVEHFALHCEPSCCKHPWHFIGTSMAEQVLHLTQIQPPSSSEV